MNSSKMTTDTLTEEQLQLRQDVLKKLLHSFGTTCTNTAIYACADEWIAKGHKITNGVVPYFRAYYEGQESSKINYKNE